MISIQNGFKGHVYFCLDVNDTKLLLKMLLLQSDPKINQLSTFTLDEYKSLIFSIGSTQLFTVKLLCCTEHSFLVLCGRKTWRTILIKLKAFHFHDMLLLFFAHFNSLSLYLALTNIFVPLTFYQHFKFTCIPNREVLWPYLKIQCKRDGINRSRTLTEW